MNKNSCLLRVHRHGTKKQGILTRQMVGKSQKHKSGKEYRECRGEASVSWNCREKASDKAGLLLSQLWSPLRS